MKPALGGLIVNCHHQGTFTKHDTVEDELRQNGARSLRTGGLVDALQQRADEVIE
jgi:hypothetical protein